MYGIDRARSRERIDELVEIFEMTDYIDELCESYSHGMKQRVVIGISTLLNPRVVIADEPTSALDVTTQKAVIRMLFDLMDAQIIGSMLFITHELPLLRHVSSRIAVMYAGEFVELGTTEQVIFDSRQPYTKALMGSMLSAEPGQKSKKPVAIEGAQAPE